MNNPNTMHKTTIWFVDKDLSNNTGLNNRIEINAS